jgi:hypothetical protein
MKDLNFKWANLKINLEDKLKFCEKIHKKHHDEVDEYTSNLDNLDKDKFNLKVKRATF